MKRHQKSNIPYAILATAILGASLHLANQNLAVFNQSEVAIAAPYQSSVNNVNPATVPDSYVVQIPDANLRRAINKAINTSRPTNSPITAGEMRALVGVAPPNIDVAGTPINLSEQSITNLEGIQFMRNVKNLDLNINRFSNLEPLRELPELVRLTMEDASQLTDISVLNTLPKLKFLNINRSKVTDLSPLSSSTTLWALHVDNLQIGNAKINLAPLTSINSLGRISVTGNRLNENDLKILNSLPNLDYVYFNTNSLTNLQSLFESGFGNLKHNSTFSGQQSKISNIYKRIIPNPLRNLDGSVIPITETATVKNVSADGTPNTTGGYIKIDTTANSGTVTADWTTTFQLPSFATARPFSGKLTLEYLIDSTAPTFSPSSPDKIISRKGNAVNINDITAQDETGGSGLTAAGVTNNATVISFNPTNPTPGSYTLTYTVTDNAGNLANVAREIEITDADSLAQKLTFANTIDGTGYTAATFSELTSKITAAQAINNLLTAPQSQINQALANLNAAINALRAEKSALTAAIANAESKPQYIKDEVTSQLADANSVLNNELATPAQVTSAINSLSSAISNAEAVETARQNDAEAAIVTATASKVQSDFVDTQTKIDLVKDPIKKAQYQAQLDTLKNNFIAKKNTLNDLLALAQLPATVEGMTPVTTAALGTEIANATNTLSLADPSQSQIEAALSILQNALDNLRADKQPLTDALNNYDVQPIFIQNLPAITTARNQVLTTQGLANPSVADVQTHAQALNDAITQALNNETDAQNTAEIAIEAAEAIIANFPNLAPNTLPTIDIEYMRGLINAALDPTWKTDWMARLDNIAFAYNTRRDEVAAYIALHGNSNTTSNNTTTPNSGYKQQSIVINIPIIGAIIGAIFASIVAWKDRKHKQ